MSLRKPDEYAKATGLLTRKWGIDMCRGCIINIDGGEPSTEEYLNWFDQYVLLMANMKALNKDILGYEQRIDNSEQKQLVSSFRRKLLNLKREYGKAALILSDIKRVD